MEKYNKIPWELILSKLENKTSSKDEQQLLEWLSDNKHLEIFNEIQSIWQTVQNRAGEYTPNTDYYWKELVKKLDLPSINTHKKFIQLKKIYQIAACIAIVLICSVSFYLGRTWNSKQLMQQTYTNVNGKYQITLPDGTLVWLHDNTTLSYKTDFQKKYRTVDLKGEAFFEVAKDPKKRFIVHADGINVMVYGTKFNVSSQIGKEEVGVSLLEGSVALSSSKNSKEQLLQPGETATYNKKSNKIFIRKSTEIDVAWVAPTIQFSNRSLREICEVLSQRYGIDIHVNSSIGDKYIYTFKLHDETIQEILTLMASINPFEYSFQNDGSIIISK